MQFSSVVSCNLYITPANLTARHVNSSKFVEIYMKYFSSAADTVSFFAVAREFQESKLSEIKSLVTGKVC